MLAGRFVVAAALGALLTLGPPSVVIADPITEFEIPTANSYPYSIAAGSDGALWFTETDGRKIGRITTAGDITEFPLQRGRQPLGITAGPDGALWFAESSSPPRIGRITTAGVISEFAIRAEVTEPQQITTGADGALWFTEEELGADTERLGRLTPDGNYTEVPLTRRNTVALDVAAGPDGALWFTEERLNRRLPDLVGRLATDGTISEFPLPRPPTGGIADVGSWAITAGPDDAMWVTNRDGDEIVRVATTGEVKSVRRLRDGSWPWEITTGPDGALWFAENGVCGGGCGPGDTEGQGGNKIGRLTPEGTLTECPVPTADALPQGIAVGSDGAIWFTEVAANKIGRLEPGGCLARGVAVGVERNTGELLVSVSDGGSVRTAGTARRRRFVAERRARQIPVGSLVDVRDGSMILTSGVDPNGNRMNSGVFSGGRFQVLQSRNQSTGMTTLRLSGGDFRVCGARTASRRVVRRLFGRARGSFRTRGRHSSATVRGTNFTVADRCDGTLTKVSRGTVEVRDFRLGRTVTLRAGQTYLARAR